jgi:hypothetical protein
MLRITVEIFPGGRQSHRRELAIMDIANISALSDISDYAVQVSEQANPVAGKKAWSSKGHILKHDRRQNVFSLVKKAASWACAEAEKQ